ncbi:MAG: NAD-dependent epimerase/dehydratase family protein [Candidatus Thermoplasmatota archaeon]|nr:NAD-dependent epimerase/dehydratase family protein [Candidatus Thermoplasmatota archaeon]
MDYFITGGAGFIGSAVVDRFAPKNRVTVYDNLSSGRQEFISHHKGRKGFKFVKADLLDIEKLIKNMKGHDTVWHMAANPDIRKGTESTMLDLEQNTFATFNVLECARRADVKSVVFSSTSTVYGRAKKVPTHEDYGPLMPISLYGASKLACEALVSAYAELYGIRAYIYRFANIIGHRSTHGILFDLVQKLNCDPTQLEVLGDGNQRKSYLLVNECVDGMVYGFKNSKDKVNYFNLGSQDQISVKKIVKVLVDETKLKGVKINYTGGESGWKGDVPKFLLDTKKMSELGWKPKHNSEDAIRKAAKIVVDEYLKVC